MQEIGLPTYWVAVISNEHVNSSTVVKWLCIRNSTESVMISCRFKYLLSPPSSLYMIVSVCRYRATRTTSFLDVVGGQRRRRFPETRIHQSPRPSLPRAPAPPPPLYRHHQHHVRSSRARGHLSSRRITNFNGGSRTTRTYHQPALTSVAHPPRSRANESSKTKRERDTSTVVHAACLSTSLLFSPPSSVSPSLRCPATSPSSSIAPPPSSSSLSLSLCLSFSRSLSPSLSLPPSVPFFYGLSFSLSLSVTLYPRRGSFLPSTLRTRSVTEPRWTSSRRVLDVFQFLLRELGGSRARVNHLASG